VLINIDSDKLILIKELDTAATNFIADGEIKKAAAAVEQISFIATNAVMASIGLVDKSNTEKH